jgi:hypothetical protein
MKITKLISVLPCLESITLLKVCFEIFLQDAGQEDMFIHLVKSQFVHHTYNPNNGIVYFGDVAVFMVKF